MNIIDPVTIDDSTLTSSSVAEADYAAWNSGTTYALSTVSVPVRVIKAHRRWESIQASNLNKDPETSPTWWADMGPTNRHAMFDEAVGTSTTDIDEIEVVLEPGAVDTIALLDVEAGSVEASLTVDAVEVWSETQSTEVGGQAITDWYLYFTARIGQRRTLLFEDIPLYSDGVITVTATSLAPAGAVEIGTMAIGRQMEIGSVESGAKAGINDFSKKTTDDYGQTRFVERSWAKRMGLRLLIHEDMVDHVYETLADLRARPIVWIASRRFDCLVIYGAWKTFEFDIQFGPNSYFSLDIEGLI